MTRRTLIAVGLALGCGCRLVRNYEPVHPDHDTVPADTASRDTNPSDTAPVDTFPSDVDGSTTGDTDTSTDSSETPADADGDATDVDPTVDFRIVSPRSNNLVDYRLEVVREPNKVRDGSRFQAEESNDTVTARQNSWLIDGATGTAPSETQIHGDSYWWDRVDTPKYGIKCWSTPAPAYDYTISIDGTEIDPSRLPEPTKDCKSS